MAHWYKGLPPHQSHSFSQSEISNLYQKAESLHAARLSPKNGSTSESSFLSKIVHSGTLSDRLSALTLLVQNDPIANTSALDTLKSMAERGKGKGGRDESLKALRCIVDWWVGGGAPDRKLRYFRDQPLAQQKDDFLILWYFEDWLKKFFFSVLQILEVRVLSIFCSP